MHVGEEQDMKTKNVPCDREFQAEWIWDLESKDNHKPNTWMAFRKKVIVDKKPYMPVVAWIAAESKYWMYINGEMVVFEGQLKRGPSREDTYVDTVDISEYLVEGENTISVLVDFFGIRDFSSDDRAPLSYSDNSSGKGAFLFEAITEEISICSDDTWKVKKQKGYIEPVTAPNYRIPETDLNYDTEAAREMEGFYEPEYNDSGWNMATKMGKPPVAPWNRLWERTIPLWKDSGIIKMSPTDFKVEQTVLEDVVKYTLHLPTNIHSTAYFKVNSASKGKVIKIYTNCNDIVPAGQAQYITKEGVQEYESLLWLAGWELYLEVPKEVEVLELGYRMTGYQTEFTGSFVCDDEWLNQMWVKSRDTLYVTMRDSFMDCPDRERAQWWGDAVIESEMAFYSLDTDSYQLIRKGISTIKEWSLDDVRITVPLSREWFELPAQSLAGIWGEWTYYLYTGDTSVMNETYHLNANYLLKHFTMNEDGLINHREGSWDWADWGKCNDYYVVSNSWYYMALGTVLKTAEFLHTEEYVEELNKRRESIHEHFDEVFWNGCAYHSDVALDIDDRANALAVLAGLAEVDKYSNIRKILQTQEYASPYMEKYVLEALCVMGYEQDAIDRMKKRYQPMFDSNTPTLWELFPTGGTANHAWSGGPLVILSKYFAGVAPTEPGYEHFKVRPHFGGLTKMDTNVTTVRGDIKVYLEKEAEKVIMSVTIPKGTIADVSIPNFKGPKAKVLINGQEFDVNSVNFVGVTILEQEEEYLNYCLQDGTWKFEI